MTTVFNVPLEVGLQGPLSPDVTCVAVKPAIKRVGVLEVHKYAFYTKLFKHLQNNVDCKN